MDNFGFKPTNTMASTSFDILTMEGIDDPLINVNTLATLDLEESYFVSALNFINETNKEIINSKEVLYKSISEATEQYVVLESFSDFFSKINDIINKFIKFIKSLAARFLTHMNKIIKSDKYINAHKKDFKNFKSADEFTMNGYTYTFNSNIPVANASLEFNKNLFEDLYTYTNDNKLSADGVSSAISAIDLTELCDKFRGEVLGLDYTVSVGEFDTELFKIFRNGDMDTSELTIGSFEVSAALDRFTSFSTAKKQIENDQKRIEDDYENVKKQVRELTKRNGDLNMSAFLNRLPDSMSDIKTASQGITMSSDLMYKLDVYTKAKVDQITEYSNIHTLAFSAKLDALKESYKQDRALLYTALLKIQRTDNARKEK